MTTPKDENEKSPDDIAVTEVSETVLAELSDIFGTSKQKSQDSQDDTTPRTGEHDDDDTAETTVVVIEEDSSVVVISESVSDHVVEVDESSGEVRVSGDFESGEVVFADTAALARAGVDPLLIAMTDDGDVISIVDDDQGMVVLDADEVDRVVIVDDDRPDSSFEERRRRRERRERLKKVKWLKLAGIAVGCVVFVMAVLASPLFAIRSVTFEGNVYTAESTVDSVRKALDGASTFTVDTAKARRILLDDPWVAEVRITTNFPGRALVEISERVPVVWYVGDDQKARIVDARGHVIEVLDGWPTKYLRVQGTGPSLEAGAIADDVYRAAAQLVLALPDEIRPLVKALDLSAGGELSMILKGGTIVRFGPPTDLQRKLVAVVVLLRRQDPATLAVVDVSTGEPTVQTR
jgi:cell division protein FtsQ